MICGEYRCLFVHVPKTAGMSIEHVLRHSYSAATTIRGSARQGWSISRPANTSPADT